MIKVVDIKHVSGNTFTAKVNGVCVDIPISRFLIEDFKAGWFDQGPCVEEDVKRILSKKFAEFYNYHIKEFRKQKLDQINENINNTLNYGKQII